MKSLNEALDWRYATKSFDPAKKVAAADLKVILDAGRMAPTSFGLQPLHLTVIEDKALREKLKPVSWNQSQITDGSHLVVFQSRVKLDSHLVDKYMARIASVRNVGADSLVGFRGMLLGNLNPEPAHPYNQEWAKRQAYICLGFMLLAAAQLGVDSCPIEGINGAEYDKILGADNLQTIAVMALGYRAAGDPYAQLKKVRQGEDEFLTRR